MNPNGYEVIFPEWFEDYAWEFESKGWLDGIIIKYEEHEYRPVFYDSVRLAQTITDDLSSQGCFLEKNLIVVERINRKNLLSAIEVFMT
ncbi:hypothetical protein [Aquirhabdus parva]|uniref:Uncharacterized protein n=1 Tax=Aquirhabdus parva TaxID=2283318 RepID=A0A345P8S9_9GAMM|nr:hypothetical protein [Aquirhabdus parva]AXI03688.1 hypothetical protein HYN46_13125 [Aquirhabdus parva]